jgi:hypothetical protein
VRVVCAEASGAGVRAAAAFEGADGADIEGFAWGAGLPFWGEVAVAGVDVGSGGGGRVGGQVWVFLGAGACGGGHLCGTRWWRVRLV